MSEKKIFAVDATFEIKARLVMFAESIEEARGKAASWEPSGYTTINDHYLGDELISETTEILAIALDRDLLSFEQVEETSQEAYESEEVVLP